MCLHRRRLTIELCNPRTRAGPTLHFAPGKAAAVSFTLDHVRSKEIALRNSCAYFQQATPSNRSAWRWPGNLGSCQKGTQSKLRKLPRHCGSNGMYIPCIVWFPDLVEKKTFVTCLPGNSSPAFPACQFPGASHCQSSKATHALWHYQGSRPQLRIASRKHPASHALSVSKQSPPPSRSGGGRKAHT